MCVLGMRIYGLRLCVLCGHSSTARQLAGKFYVLACFTFQLPSFVRTAKLFNMRRTTALRGTRPWGIGECSTKVCQSILYTLMLLFYIFRTVKLQAHTQRLPSTRLKC